MSIVETATPGLESTSIRARVSGVLPLVGIGFGVDRECSLGGVPRLLHA